MALPDGIDLIVTRMKACWEEISGMGRAYKELPTALIADADLPAVFPLLGSMTQPAPGPSAGWARIPATFTYRLLVLPLGKASVDSADDGAYAMNQAALWPWKVLDFFLHHPRLETSTLGALNYTDQDLSIQYGAPGEKPGPGGGPYVGIDFTFVISLRVPLNPARVS